ncbi:MAG: hypothetical protein GOVbin630_130 [Prokaryotic dsDNA virus sp.]|nr:MAG: hypothetical protein GOVbin630_130 [Prokaryotic dsDNA virus sp.]|tara:strand:- start:951 stop:1148 length:198 start_codon:yes stop_codon:yes gene_type:complete
MCLVCEEYKKGKLTLTEALRNLEEMKSSMDPDHYQAISDMLRHEMMEEELELFWQSLGLAMRFGG